MRPVYEQTATMHDEEIDGAIDEGLSEVRRERLDDRDVACAGPSERLCQREQADEGDREPSDHPPDGRCHGDVVRPTSRRGGGSRR